MGRCNGQHDFDGGAVLQCGIGLLLFARAALGAVATAVTAIAIAAAAAIARGAVFAIVMLVGTAQRRFGGRAGCRLGFGRNVGHGRIGGQGRGA